MGNANGSSGGNVKSLEEYGRTCSDKELIVLYQLQKKLFTRLVASPNVRSELILDTFHPSHTQSPRVHPKTKGKALRGGMRRRMLHYLKGIGILLREVAATTSMAAIVVALNAFRIAGIRC